jgi:cephalosporin-C deacetylase-like acetyl esterase
MMQLNFGSPRLLTVVVSLALVAAIASKCRAAEQELVDAETVAGMELLFAEDFESGRADRWEPTDADAWRVVRVGDNHVFSQFVKRSNYNPPVRSPYNRALIKDVEVSSFVLDVKLLSTHPDYPHRDLCVFFGYQDAAHLFYVHLGKRMDDHANNIFIVDGSDRKKISTSTTSGTNWDDDWHHVRVVRDVVSGGIEVFFDDMTKPVMTATNWNFTWGRVGVGSFDDTGNFDDIQLHGVRTQPLPGTKPFAITGPLDAFMVAGINKFALRALEGSAQQRTSRWNRDYSDPQAYEKSVQRNRERFRTIIGAVDQRVAGPGIELMATTEHDSVVARTDSYVVHRVKWQVLDGVTAEGLLLQPDETPSARVIALPDADWSPEMFAGLTKGVSARSHIPSRLANSGIEVLVPVLISRDDTHSGNPEFRMTNQPHREFVYRMAFQMGRHVIGYEVQKVLAAVDLCARLNEAGGDALPVGVVGVGEGGLLALYSAALDPRIDSAMVSGYFQQREQVWSEPIYRNVWSLLREFGDAEIASLIAPRRLVIEACSVPEVSGPPKPRSGRSGAAPGRIEIATLGSVRVEYDRALDHYQKLNAAEELAFVASGEGDGPAGTDAALTAFLQGLRLGRPSAKKSTDSMQVAQSVDSEERQKRQLDELVSFTQRLLRHSAAVRDRFWSKADRTSVASWVASAEHYRNYVWEEMIGKLPEPTMPINVRTRKVIDETAYAGYEVVLDVYPDVVAAGILLVPSEIQEGEKRPVVVCQHGLEGRPMDTITPTEPAHNYYRSFAARLAERGFVTYSPQNPYRGRDEFRTIQRKSNPMQRSLFSYIVRQHERTLDLLSSLEYVDPDRIGFYGLSYGGKTAVRVPPLLSRYALSICSADFNEWIRKNVTNNARYTYMFTGEYEMFEWNMGHTANYAELASLMTPRPFMVERGHDDGVAPDEWVAWEYAKVRRHYVKLGLPDSTRIEFFDGPHSINAEGTFAFLHRHLNWPEPEVSRRGQ